MKTLLATLNSKYIHTSLALRWLYVVNKEKFDICFKEYTIKESVKSIAEDIVSSGCNILGLGVYIWNVQQTQELCSELKKRNPSLIIILGGPEVSYEPEYFIQNWQIDYIVSGEGEFVLGDLLDSIQNEKEIDIEAVSTKLKISKAVAIADINKLIEFPSPYSLEEDRNELKNRLVYFETSRGCPYKCKYCLSSLESGVRFFSKDYIIENLKYIIESQAKRVKFLDRSFNINKNHSIFIFDFLMKNYRKNLSFQFEVYANLLNDEIIDFLNKNLINNYFRFEIGIQSTHEATNIAVKRQQNFSLISSNIKKIVKGGKIDLHLDLIAGLPYETFELFVNSFNQVFEFGAKEVQLGFLKMLRGTALRKNASKYSYKFDDNSPYQIKFNQFISEQELAKIHEVEQVLDKFWNSARFTNTMKRLVTNEYKLKYFELFVEISDFVKLKNFPKFSYQLEDLFKFFNEFLESKNIEAKESLRDDYYSNFKNRPSSYWCEIIDKKEKKWVINSVSLDLDFIQKHNLTKQIVENNLAIYPLGSNKYLLTIFDEEQKRQVIWSK